MVLSHRALGIDHDLRRMEAAGLIERRVYQTRLQRFEYVLTERGEALLPVLQEMCRWANKYVRDTWIPPDSFTQPLAR